MLGPEVSLLQISRAPRYCAGSFAELMERNTDNLKAPTLFWKRVEIRIDIVWGIKDLLRRICYRSLEMVE